MADAILDFTTGTEASFGKMLARILRQIASAQLQKALNPLMSQAGGFLTTLISGFFGSGTNVGGVSSANGGIPASTVYGPGSGWGLSALGNVFGPAGKMKFFANGGIVNGATGFAHAGGMGIMGEAGPEAIMPLERDASGKLGVGAAPVSIEINNYSGAQISQSESVDTNGNKRISILVEKAVEDGFATGRFDKTMRNSFGLARKGR
jgi:lambda family phage tail tape measure protein